MPLTGWTYYTRITSAGSWSPLTNVSFPEAADLVFEDVREDNQVFYRRYLRTQFAVNGADFNTFDTWVTSSACTDVQLDIRYNASSVWTGRINLRKSSWFPDRCQMRFTPDPISDDDCLRQGWETEYNVIDEPPATVETFFGTVVQVTCGPVNNPVAIEVMGYFEQNVSACLSGSGGLDAYTISRAYIEEITPGSSYDHYATYHSEQATIPCVSGAPVPPPGDGWILINNDCGGSGNATYARPVRVAYEGEKSATTGKYWDNTYSIVGEDVAQYENGRAMQDVLEAMLSDCGYSVVSDFFGINPDATAPANTPYTYAAVNLQNILLFQKTDIKNPTAAQPATVANIRLKRLLEIFEEVFNCRWRVEASTLRIEHVSYFVGANGTDLTSTSPALVARKNAYAFDTENIPTQEEYNWSDDTFDSDFSGQPIIYSSTCVDIDAEPSVLTVKDVFTDFEAIYNNPDSVKDEGFFMMATYESGGSYYMNKIDGAISGQPKFNGALSWANLHANLFTYARPLPTGTLNGSPVVFDDYTRTKRQEPLTFFIQPNAYFALDFTEKIRSYIGWGEVDRASYSAAACSLTVELLHEE